MNETAQPKKRKQSMFRYYIIMLGILIAELGVAYLFYLFAVNAEVLFAVFCLVLFGAGIAYLVYSRYREKIKISPVEEVKYRYRKSFKWVVIAIFGVIGVLIVVKAIILLIGSLF